MTEQVEKKTKLKTSEAQRRAVKKYQQKLRATEEGRRIENYKTSFLGAKRFVRIGEESDLIELYQLLEERLKRTQKN